jgi:hypothetical protein
LEASHNSGSRTVDCFKFIEIIDVDFSDFFDSVFESGKSNSKISISITFDLEYFSFLSSGLYFLS